METGKITLHCPMCATLVTFSISRIDFDRDGSFRLAAAIEATAHHNCPQKQP